MTEGFNINEIVFEGSHNEVALRRALVAPEKKVKVLEADNKKLVSETERARQEKALRSFSQNHNNNIELIRKLEVEAEEQ